MSSPPSRRAPNNSGESNSEIAAPTPAAPASMTRVFRPMVGRRARVERASGFVTAESGIVLGDCAWAVATATPTSSGMTNRTGAPWIICLQYAPVRIKGL